MFVLRLSSLFRVFPRGAVEKMSSASDGDLRSLQMWAASGATDVPGILLQGFRQQIPLCRQRSDILLVCIAAFRVEYQLRHDAIANHARQQDLRVLQGWHRF